MNKTFLVFRNEILTAIRRKSFVIMLFLLPLIGFGVTTIIGNSQKSNTTNAIANLFVSPPKNLQYGVFDGSNLLTSIPYSEKDIFTLYTSEQAAQNAMNEGKIDAFYVIDPNYIDNGKVILKKTELDLMGNDPDWRLENLIDQSLLKNDPTTLARIQNPMDFQTVVQSTEVQRDPESMLTFYIPYIVTMLFYFVILTSASLMLTSITNEKANRVMEILMTSITPMQLLAGKILALGLVGLIQTVVWTGTGFLLLRLSGKNLSLGQAVQVPPSILMYGVLFFVSGYFLYASLMAGAGALVPNIKEASQATTILIIPLIIPLILISAIVQSPNGTLAVLFSLFPLTSPVTMMTRLAAGSVPWWQIVLALVLILLTAYAIIRSVSRFFRAQNLLSGQEFKAKYFFKALFGKSQG